MNENDVSAGTAQPLLYIAPSLVNVRPGSFRDYYRAIYGPLPLPVDRFGLLPQIDETSDYLPTINIVPEPKINLSNLNINWRDRYFSLLDDIATRVYQCAGSRRITVMYSGGIDSTAALVALMRNSQFKDLLQQNRIAVALTSTSIVEYPEFFYQHILPSMPIVYADYDQLLNQPDSFIVTGDAGDYVIGNTDTPIFFHNGSTENLSEDKSALWPYLDSIDHSKKFSWFAREIAKLAPFDIDSVNQMFWWIGQAFVNQGEMCYPYIWSRTTDLSELKSFNKIFRFFLDPQCMNFSFEYMSTNPYYTDYNSVRQFPREYIVNYTKHQSYLKKIKVFSQRLMFLRRHKTRIYSDLTYSNDISTYQS